MSQPRPSSVNFQDLLTDIHRGTIKIPQFQREFVWEPSRSAKLLDSILKGYPLGTFILWKTKERLRAIRNIGNIELPAPPEGDYVLQVLDGQQRITSLFAALEGVKLSPHNDFSEIYVDLDANPDGDDPIVLAKHDEMPEGHVRIPFKTLRASSLMQLMRVGYTETQLERLEEYKRRLETYRFPTVEIADAPLAVATEIFTRLNVGGRSLTLFEIMVAKTWDDARKFDLNEKVRELDAVLSESGYGGMDQTILMQAVPALVLQGIKAKDILGMSRTSFIDNWDVAANAMKHAIDFCRSNLSIPVRALLPYQRSLIPLAYYFHLAGKDPVGETKRRLIDLFFRIGLSERYSSATETKLAQDLKAVDSIHAGVQPVYDYGVNVDAAYILRNGQFRTGKAFVKTLLCVLAAERPRCFKSGGNVLLDNALLKQKNSRNYHHFFPTHFVEKAGVYQNGPNHVGNITLVGADLNKHSIRARRPSDYIAAFGADNSELAACLATHLISMDDMGVMEDAYDTFLPRRCERLADKLHALLIPQAKDGIAQPDIVEEDESPDIVENEEEQAL